MKQSLELIEQLISMAEKQDEQMKAMQHRMHKSVQTIGESSLVFHLRALKELVARESKIIH